MNNNYTGKYHAVWYKLLSGEPHKGITSSNFEQVLDEVLFRRSLGFIAWIEDDESNKIEE